MPIATMTTNGRVTIPKEIRDELGIQPGTKVAFVLTEHGFVMKVSDREGPLS